MLILTKRQKHHDFLIGYGIGITAHKILFDHACRKPHFLAVCKVGKLPLAFFLFALYELIFYSHFSRSFRLYNSENNSLGYPLNLAAA